MPIHYNIPKHSLLEEVRRLEQAGMIVRFIVPDMIEHPPGHIFAIVMSYAIIFDEP